MFFEQVNANCKKLNYCQYKNLNEYRWKINENYDIPIKKSHEKLANDEKKGSKYTKMKE